jgi:GNAT superfamily N-acetyltransferase
LWIIGRQLIDATIAWSRAQGARHVGVAVHAFNRDARRFYERAGLPPRSIGSCSLCDFSHRTMLERR